MAYIAANWGSFVGLLSLTVTVVGLFLVFRRAGEAQTSAAAASAAALETREAINRVLTIADLQRAIALIERLKGLHRDKKWDASVGHYSDLRHMLSDIDATHPEPSQEIHKTLIEAIPQITVIENSVDRALREGTTPAGARNFNTRLNIIQDSLQEIASSTDFAGSEAR